MNNYIMQDTNYNTICKMKENLMNSDNIVSLENEQYLELINIYNQLTDNEKNKFNNLIKAEFDADKCAFDILIKDVSGMLAVVLGEKFIKAFKKYHTYFFYNENPFKLLIK